VPIISGTDTLEFYAQHDLEAIGDTGNFNYYSLYSEGMEPGKLATIIIFKINKQTGQLSIINKRWPYEAVISSGAGNYDVEPSGNYLINYGQYPLKDTTNKPHYFMELRNKNEQVYARYKLPGLIFTYKVHALTQARPPRPVIVEAKDNLVAQGDMQEWTWYLLSGANNTVVQQLGTGAKFAPHTTGTYCVAGKYGIGWSVSKPFTYQAKLKKEKK